MCTLHRRKSVATTIGFTALDGLPMGRRCGNLDPGVVLYLIQEKGMTAPAVGDLLYKKSGLFGVSGVSDDMRVLLASDHPRGKGRSSRRGSIRATSPTSVRSARGHSAG